MHILSEHKCFDGLQLRVRHPSAANHCEMTYSLYLPPQALAGGRVPLLYWLSGLTCTDENFTQKAGAQRYAAQYGLALVMPDTSPRGEGVPDDPAYDLGQGAGFYLNATQTPWAQHYHMYDYITAELPAHLAAHYPLDDRAGIAGHSMGGHGALQIALKNPARYAAVSAFAPIVNPGDTPWGQKAFTAYLGDDKHAWPTNSARAKSAAKPSWTLPGKRATAWITTCTPATTTATTPSPATSARTSPSTPKHWGWGNRKTNRRPALGDIHNYRRPAG